MTVDNMEVFGPNDHIPNITIAQLADIQALLGERYGIDREEAIDEDGQTHFFVDQLSADAQAEAVRDIQDLLGPEYSVTQGGRVNEIVDEETGEVTEEEINIISVGRVK